MDFADDVVKDSQEKLRFDAMVNGSLSYTIFWPA